MHHLMGHCSSYKGKPRLYHGGSLLVYLKQVTTPPQCALRISTTSPVFLSKVLILNLIPRRARANLEHEPFQMITETSEDGCHENAENCAGGTGGEAEPGPDVKKLRRRYSEMQCINLSWTLGQKNQNKT